jgi:hypothetical protein
MFTVRRGEMPPREAAVVAGLLGVSPEQLTGIKLLPGDDTSDAPMPDDFTFVERKWIEFTDDDGHFSQREMFRFDTPFGPVAIVKHESGEEILTVLQTAADSIGVLGGIGSFMSWAKSRRHKKPKAGETIRERRYTANGDEKSSAPLDENTPLSDQIRVP